MSAGDKILIVDDEPDIPRLLRSYLLREGLVPLVAETGAEAIRMTRDDDPSLIVLDIMLPDIDGFEVCRRIRRFSDCPIIFLTARTEEADKVLGFGLGGDDYVVKPFSPRNSWSVSRQACGVRLLPTATVLDRSDDQGDHGEGQSGAPGRAAVDGAMKRAVFDDCVLDWNPTSCRCAAEGVNDEQGVQPAAAAGDQCQSSVHEKAAVRGSLGGGVGRRRQHTNGPHSPPQTKIEHDPSALSAS